ncbi:MAG: EamA family transporter, partial [Syntrophomonadaceae bacterium]
MGRILPSICPAEVREIIMEQVNVLARSAFEKPNKYAIGMAILAAVLYGVSSPLSKLLLVKMPPTLMAALLYLGAGAGMLLVNWYVRFTKPERMEAKITEQELPYVLGMVGLDIAAPILLMLGLTRTTAENAALLNNFEIVATSLLAMIIFREAVGRRMWLSISLITLASIILSVDNFRHLTLSPGSLFILAACLCWGLENNCTRMLSLKDPLQIVVIKGLGSGLGALLITWAMHAFIWDSLYIVMALLLGFVAYGLSIFFYVSAQRELGAARTSTYYAAAPFIGVLFSWIILRESLTASFALALVLMLIGTYFAVSEHHGHSHMHPEMTHEHRHNHEDGHH